MSEEEAKPKTAVPYKAGYKTTEFWVTMITNLVAVAALFGAIAPNDAAPLTEAFVKIIMAGVAIWTNGQYIGGRVNIKIGRDRW